MLLHEAFPILKLFFQSSNNFFQSCSSPSSQLNKVSYEQIHSIFSQFFQITYSSLSKMVTLPSTSYVQASSLTRFLRIQNITHLIPVKLTKDNYILWKSLWTPVLECFDLDSFITDESDVPQKILNTVNIARVSVPTINPEYQAWRKKDQQLLIWLNATISELLLSYVSTKHPINKAQS